MAGGGEAGELDEDKLDKGIGELFFDRLSPTNGSSSGRSFPTTHTGTG